MPVTILSIGKKHTPLFREAITKYENRLRKPYLTQWVFLAHSKFDGERARDDESVRILSTLRPDDFVVVLDERGKLLDSPTFTDNMHSQLSRSLPVVIIIGGAYGVSPELRNRANLLISLSPLVFPHQLVRVMLIEQIYRAYTISSSLPYHNE